MVTTNTQKDFDRMLESALYYAKVLGWKVLPVRTPRGDGSDSDGKIPWIKGWQKNASCDSEAIKQWWQRRFLISEGRDVPNIGIAAGLSGLVVIDIDPKAGGDLMGLPTTFEEQQTATARTGSGGLHLYYKAPPGKHYRNTAGMLAPGIDTRAEGGQVLAPPSVHKSGERYLWEPELSPKHGVLELPECLVERLEKSASSTSAGGEAILLGKTIPRGERNASMFSLGGMMRWKGAADDTIHVCLMMENQAKCTPPLKDEEVVNIANSVCKYAPGEE